MRSLKKVLIAVVIIMAFVLFSFYLIQSTQVQTKKPVIYLYPTEEQRVSVELEYQGEFTCTYPNYDNGWDVIAHPDGTIINLKDQREYSYLYWEGISEINYDMSKGFVVKGEETEEFLKDKLEFLGLTPREYNEFIVYWLPLMQENEYNLITFVGKEYDDLAKLKITPQPDSILRVMMAYKPLKYPVIVEEQELETFERKGFSVIEWGGVEVK